MPGFFLSADPQGRLARRVATAALLASLALPGLALAQSAGQKIQSDIFAARTGLPRGWVVSNKPGVVVAIRDRDAPRAAGEKIRLQGEVVDDEAVDRLGYRSMRSVVEVNCETRRDRVVEMEVFSAPNLQGVGQKRTVPGGWVQPSQDAYMADVIRTVCRGAAPRPVEPAAEPAPPPVSKAAAAKPAPKPASPVAPARAAVQEPISRLLQARIVPVGGEPANEPRVPTSTEAPITTAQRVPRILEPLQAPPEPAAPVASVAPPPLAEPPPPPAPAKPKPKPPAPPAGPIRHAVAGGLTVQVGALDSDADARRALKGLAGQIGEFSPSVQAVKVGERTFYRALVSGFADRADAQAFCAQVSRKGGTCLLR